MWYGGIWVLPIMSEQPSDPKQTGGQQPPARSEPTFTIKRSHVWLALRIAAGVVGVGIYWYMLSH